MSDVNNTDVVVRELVEMSATLTFVADSAKIADVPDQFLAAFGATVRRLRDARGMTQAELAERVGLGRTSMTNLERGNQNPPLSMLPLLAHGLGLSASELIAEIDSPGGDSDHDVLATTSTTKPSERG